MYQKWDNKSISSCQNTLMLHEQDNGSMMGPLNVEHFRFDDADIAMVIPQQLASLQRGKAWKTHYRRHIAFFCCWDACGRLFFPDPHFIRYAHWQSIETTINWVFQPPLIWLYDGVIIKNRQFKKVVQRRTVFNIFWSNRSTQVFPGP